MLSVPSSHDRVADLIAMKRFEILLLKTRKAITLVACYVSMLDIANSPGYTFAVEQEHRRSLQYSIHGSGARRGLGGRPGYGDVMRWARMSAEYLYLGDVYLIHRRSWKR